MISKCVTANAADCERVVRNGSPVEVDDAIRALAVYCANGVITRERFDGLRKMAHRYTEGGVTNANG